MKIVYNGIGADNTLATKNYLLASRNPIVHNLYQIGPSRIPRPLGTGQPADLPSWAFYWTDADYPIHSTYLAATYMPQKIKRSTLQYKLGTESSTLSLDLNTLDIQQPLILTGSPRGMPPYQDAAMTLNGATDLVGGWQMIYTLKAAIAQGDLDGLAFTMWRVFEQTKGDADTLGVCAMFRGYISGAICTRSSISLQVASLMQTLQVQVPTQTIQPSDRGWLYTPRTNFDFATVVDDLHTSSSFVWVTGATITDHVLGDGWMVFVASAGVYRNSGTYPTYNSYYQRRIRDNVTFSNPFGAGPAVLLYMYEPLPWKVYSGDTAFLFSPSTPSGTKGFKFVPIPETVA